MPILKKWVSAEDKAYHVIVGALESHGFYVEDGAAEALAAQVGNDSRSDSGWESETIGTDDDSPETIGADDDSPPLSIEDWKSEVAGGLTLLGYSEWCNEAGSLKAAILAATSRT